MRLLPILIAGSLAAGFLNARTRGEISTRAVQAIPKVTLDVPSLYLEGEPFMAKVTLQAPSIEPLDLPAWAFTGEAFTVGKKQLGTRRVTEKVRLQPGQVFSTSLDLGPMIAELELEPRDITIGWTGIPEVPKVEVSWLEAAEKGIEFMDLPREQLGDYQVALQTNRGLIWLDLWPDVAPNHVRSFLDLAYTGFYDGTTFHRVIPGFMIQGGKARAGEVAPRKLDAEFNTKRHARGVLSMARLGHDVNSASSEFFIMHAENAELDGKYTAFGTMLRGDATLDAIVVTGNSRFSPSDPRGYTPTTPQVIQRAVVVKASKSRR